MTVTDDDKMPIGHNSSLLQRFHEAWDRLEGIGATLGEDGGEGCGESPVIGHYVLLCGAGCCLWARGFSGHQWAARPRPPVPPAPFMPVAVGVLQH